MKQTKNELEVILFAIHKKGPSNDIEVLDFYHFATLCLDLPLDYMPDPLMESHLFLLLDHCPAKVIDRKLLALIPSF